MRRSTLSMSWRAAPEAEVTMPTRLGSAGSGRLRSAAKRPSCLEALFELFEGQLQGAHALRLHVVDDQLKPAPLGIDGERTAGQHGETVLERET